jgi:hypothetical protein
MAISELISKLSGTPSIPTCRNSIRRLNNCSKKLASPASNTSAPQIVAVKSATPYPATPRYPTKRKSPASFLTGLGYM